MAGPSASPQSGGVERIVVLLHGYGADGNDLIDLASPLSGVLPQTLFVSPHAPARCEMGPFGRQWFSLADYDPGMIRRDPVRMGRVHDRMRAGADAAAPALNRFLDHLLASHGLGPERLALLGFSQGAMMALHVALRRPAPVAAVVGLSGALLGAHSLSDEITARPPVRLIHGDADGVVPVQALGAAREALEAAEVPVEAYIRPGVGHGIDQRGLELAAEHLAHNLA